MKQFKAIVIAFLFFVPMLSFAQTENESGSDDEQIFTIVEKMPVYPGGQDELMKFLGKNIKYPESAIRDSVQGVVYIQFTVAKDGQIKNVKVIRALHPECDAEAVRVISSMPKWEPGTQNDKPVNVLFNLPVRFRLS